MNEKKYPTPHICAEPSDFGKTVLMPGDPLRSEFIAKNYLTDARLVNNVRGVSGYTGTYDGVRVSVMASGMGMPSIGIYSYELYNFFDVQNIIRIGSAGSLSENVHVRDIVIGQASCTDSAYARQFNLPGSFAPACSFVLLEQAVAVAREKGASFHVGSLLSTDVFYGDLEGMPDYKRPLNAWSKMGVMAIEMESAALYMNAARAGKNALAMCTVSDHLITGERVSAKEREISFTDMIEIALRTAVRSEQL